MRAVLFVLLLFVSAITLGQDSVTIAADTNELSRYTLFIKGEYHERLAENEHSFLLLAKHLYVHNKVRHLVFEWGPDFSFLANRYLQTQNDSLLFKNTLFFSKAFWDTLVICNRFKSTDDKIKIAGFDFNRSVFTAKAFHEMTKGKPAFPDTAVWSLIKTVVQWEHTKWTWEGQKEFVEQMKKLQLLCKSQNSTLRIFFGDDWPSFSAIVNHDVESTPMVKRDKQSIGYVKNFLAIRSAGNVLFNLGVNHTYFDGAGMGNLLEQEESYRGKVCSIYPYHRIADAEKDKYQQEQDKNLPASFLAELQTAAPYSLINLIQKGIYPAKYKKNQWLYVIPPVKQQ